MLRVQMVSKGTPAYQNDFFELSLAVEAAGKLAAGAGAKIVASIDLLRYEAKSTVIRVFSLD